VIENFVVGVYGSDLSHVCGYTRVLD
jgi:hypothetical protein